MFFVVFLDVACGLADRPGHDCHRGRVGAHSCSPVGGISVVRNPLEREALVSRELLHRSPSRNGGSLSMPLGDSVLALIPSILEEAR